MKKTLVGILSLLIVAGLLLTPVSSAFADLGPVHIELNVTSERLGPARAGTVTAFKIYMRINVDILVHDWIKIWFPIDEASCDLDDICGSLFEVKGAKEDARFVPNDKYFKDFVNDEEKDIGKMYEILEDKKVNTRFHEGTVCVEPEGNCRIVEDPNGYGHWMLGTVLPAIPRDESDRKERTAQIIRSTSIGITPCTECQGYPILTQTCDERSFQVNSPIQVEAWRQGYNPIDFNTSKATGIVVPATPGRYRLRIATAGEPSPIESDAFVLPCSSIAPPVVTLDPPDTATASDMTINFDVGEGGALDSGSSLIMLKFPEGFVFPRKIKPRYVKVNGVPLKANPQISQENNQMTLISSSNVDNLGHVKIEISNKAEIMNPANSSKQRITAFTSSEPEPVESEEFFVGTEPKVTVTPPFEGTPSSWYAVGLVPEEATISTGDNFTIIFPTGTTIPKTIDPSTIIVNGKSCTNVSVRGNELSIVAPTEIKGALKLTIDEEAGIVNPPKGEYELKFIVKGNEYIFEKFTILESKPRITDLTLSEILGYEPAEYKFRYIPSVNGALGPGDTVTIIFPESTIMPTSIDPSKVTVDGTAVTDVKVEETTVTITINSEIPAVTGEFITFAVDSGILNPQIAGTYRLIVSSSKDEPVESPEFSTTQPKLISELRFIDPDEPDGCNGWYKSPPLLSISCRNPDAQIFFWYDLKEESQILYTGEKRLAPGSQRPIIHYYAVFGEEKEEPKSAQLFLDTVPPAIKVNEPQSTSTITANPEFTVKGERDFIEMLTDGGPSHQVADSVFVKLNDGEPIQLLDSEIFAVEDRDSIEVEWEHEFTLKEGTNTITVIGKDQACNEIKQVFTVTYDKTPPPVTIITPKDGEKFEPYSTIPVEVESEATASVYINGAIASIIEEKDGGMAVFSTDVDIEEGEFVIEVEASDVAGNTSTKSIKVYGENPQTRLKIWSGKKDFYINGKKAADLDPMPTTKSPPLPANLAGNSYMPVRAILEALGAKIDWDGDDRRVDITLAKPDGSSTFLQLWINNPIAKLNGREVKIVSADGVTQLYPAIVANRTMLPLRFALEAIKADVNWIASEQAIEIVYPCETCKFMLDL